MKDITRTKEEYLKFFSQKYYNKNPDDLTGREYCRMSMLSEGWAYLKEVIPEDHAQFSIFDFDGFNKKTKESLLSPQCVLDAKNKISLFCWGKDWNYIENLYNQNPLGISSELRKLNIMDKRLKDGCNIVIHGDSFRKLGRTMICSLIMKEAIKLRMLNGDFSRTYDWINFSNLRVSIEKENLASSEYRSCDWLVIDNIYFMNGSPQQKSLLVPPIDTFFDGRLSDKLPTICVFKFNVDDNINIIEENFGSSVVRLIESKKTLKILLSENKE